MYILVIDILQFFKFCLWRTSNFFGEDLETYLVFLLDALLVYTMTSHKNS